MRDLMEIYQPKVELPIRGRVYIIPEPEPAFGAEIPRLIWDRRAFIEMSEASLAVLGPALDEMVADNVPWSMVLHSGRTALLWFGHSPGVARRYWELGQLGSALPPDVADMLREGIPSDVT